MKVASHWVRFPRKDVGFQFFEIFKTWLDKTITNLI